MYHLANPDDAARYARDYAAANPDDSQQFNAMPSISGGSSFSETKLKGGKFLNEVQQKEMARRVVEFIFDHDEIKNGLENDRELLEMNVNRLINKIT